VCVCVCARTCVCVLACLCWGCPYHLELTNCYAYPQITFPTQIAPWKCWQTMALAINIHQEFLWFRCTLLYCAVPFLPLLHACLVPCLSLLHACLVPCLSLLHACLVPCLSLLHAWRIGSLLSFDRFLFLSHECCGEFGNCVKSQCQRILQWGGNPLFPHHYQMVVAGLIWWDRVYSEACIKGPFWHVATSFRRMPLLCFLWSPSHLLMHSDPRK
jgi:hypothetical protein